MSCKKFLFLLISFLLIGVACDRIVDDSKGDEMARLEAWLRVHNITVQPTSSGLYYINNHEGTGISPVDSQYVVFSYVKRDLDDNVKETTEKEVAVLYGVYKVRTHYVPLFTQFFSQTTNLKGVIEGLSYMKEGGKARLIIPSSIGDDPRSNTTIIYDIELKKVVLEPEIYESDLINNYILHHPGYRPIADSIYFKDSITVDPLLKINNHKTQRMVNDTVSVRYVGRYLDGFIFDTNILTIATANGITTTGDLLTFKVGSADVVKGFSIAVRAMNKGDIAKVIIPSKSGYGAKGKSPIPPYTTMLFEITIVDVGSPK